MIRVLFPVILGLGGLLGGCGLPAVPRISPEIEAPVMRLLSGFQDRNRSIRTFKGAGRLRLFNPDGTLSARAFWAGAVEEGRLRLEIRDVSGAVLALAAGDGEKFHLSVPPENRFYRTEANDPDLFDLLSVNIRTSEVIRLLSGGIPIVPHDAADFESGENGERILILRRWGTVRERIRTRGFAVIPDTVEVFDHLGDLRYRVNYQGETTFEGYSVPAVIEIGTDAAVRIRIEIERFWPHSPVTDSLFVLRPGE
jgi:hypothetical protein